MCVSHDVTVDTSADKLTKLFNEFEETVSRMSVQMAYQIGQASFARKLKALTELGS